MTAGTDSVRAGSSRTPKAIEERTTASVETNQELLISRKSVVLTLVSGAKQDPLTVNPGTFSAARAYPHLYDQAEDAGQAQVLIESAIKDAHAALNAFDDTDFEEVSSRFATIAATLGEAHRHTRFNESFGAVVSYVRRATLTADALQTSREELNTLVMTLASLQRNPAIDMDDAGELVERLSAAGWNGEHAAVEALVAALFDEDAGNGQRDFFIEVGAQAR